MRVIILNFAGLSADDLGCYGSIESTPGFDALAAQADLFELFFVDESSKKLELTHTCSVAEFFESFGQLSKNADDQNSLAVIQVTAESDQEDDKVHSYDSAIEIALKQISTDTALVVFGAYDRELEDRLHVPLIVFLPNQSEGRRRKSLLTTSDLSKLIESLKRGTEEYEKWRDDDSEQQIEYHSKSFRNIRTHKWLLQIDESHQIDDQPECQLFHKPEDVWNRLDVASQYPTLIDHFFETGSLTLPLQPE